MLLIVLILLCNIDNKKFKVFTWLKYERLDERIIRVDWDIGFVEGRQFGRGRSGGQVRDELRTYEDSGRGGPPKKQQQQQQQQQKKWENKDSSSYYKKDKNYSHIEKDIDNYVTLFL